MSLVLYFDTSALVKRYVREPGSSDVTLLWRSAHLVGTSVIARVEIEAALAKYVRMNLLSVENAYLALAQFQAEWESLIHLKLTYDVTELASELVWQHGLRGYDAVHLATALVWQQRIRRPVTFATFDKKLWLAASAAQLKPFPEDLTPFLRL